LFLIQRQADLLQRQTDLYEDQARAIKQTELDTVSKDAEKNQKHVASVGANENENTKMTNLVITANRTRDEYVQETQRIVANRNLTACSIS